MKEITIGTKIIEKRKEKGITQEALASYIGVSKASVSKWETGQSYPDILLLPQLATYFNISIDELIGYTPQMTKGQIKTLYHEMAKRFAEEPFDQVYQDCEAIIKKYYACPSLLLQMAVLYLNHHPFAEESQRQSILEEVLTLCLRIKSECQDVFILKEATSLQVICYLMMNRPQEVLELYGNTLHPIIQETEAMSQAYMFMGEMEKCREATQVSMYQHLLFLLGSSAQLLSISAENSHQVDEIVRRMLETAKIYNLADLHPNTMAIICLTGAQVYCSLGNTDKSLELLNLYVDVAKKFFPVSLHGDDYFDAIDTWLQDFDLGTAPVRNEALIKSSLLKGVTENPVFSPLAETEEFKSIVSQLNMILGGN